jgi:hypothetical protein
MIEKNGKAYCRKDFNSNFLARCATCSNPIEGQSFSVGGKQYHSTCLRCETCQTQLGGSQIYVDLRDRMVCRACASK